MAGLKPEVRIYEDLETLSRAAAEIIFLTCGQSVHERGRALMALSGGSTPERLYQLLAEPPYRDQIDWLHLHVFWGDERCVPVEDLQNNYRQAHDLLLGRVPLPPDNIHRVDSELEPGSAAEDYARLLGRYAAAPFEWPRFDLVLLGLGEDGHTASLFPGPQMESTAPVLAVAARYQDRPAWRVTLTPPVFNAARRIIFLVDGARKAAVLARVLYGKYDPDALPAQRIRPTEGELIWLLDQSAASQPQH